MEGGVIESRLDEDGDINEVKGVDGWTRAFRVVISFCRAVMPLCGCLLSLALLYAIVNLVQCYIIFTTRFF